MEKKRLLPSLLSEDWLGEITKMFDKRTMTIDQRMHFEMFLAKNVSRIEMLKEEARQSERAKGEEIGEERGKKIANRETAENLKKLGIDYQTISKSTGLSLEEIKGL